MSQTTAKNIAETIIDHMSSVGDVQVISSPVADPDSPFIIAAPDGMRADGARRDLRAA